MTEWTTDFAGAPSPHCGRRDEHDPHPWSTPVSRARGVEYECPGPPVQTLADYNQANGV